MNQQRRPSNETEIASDSPAPWRTGVVAYVAAAVADLALLGIATLAGADMVVTPTGGPTMSVGIGAILLALLVVVAIGTVGLAFFGKGRAAHWRIMALVGLVIGVVSLAAPLTADARTGTKLALSSMHLTTALIWFIAVDRRTQHRGSDTD